MNLDILLSHKTRRYSNTNGDMSERHKSYLEGTSIGHIWDSLSIKKNNGSINLVTKEFHVSTMILKKGGGGGKVLLYRRMSANNMYKE